MVKSESLKKGELMEILQSSSSTSRERNRAAKLLKRFEPTAHRDLDSEGDPKNLKPKEYCQLQGFICFRCDKVKQSRVKVDWSTSRGVKTICNSCYGTLLNYKELEQAKKILAKAAAGKKFYD